jgi:hypothetical protein
VLITSSPQGIMSMGLLTDLKSEEVLKFSQGAEVTSDDILDLYLLFKKTPNKIFDLI